MQKNALGRQQEPRRTTRLSSLLFAAERPISFMIRFGCCTHNRVRADPPMRFTNCNSTYANFSASCRARLCRCDKFLRTGAAIIHGSFWIYRPGRWSSPITQDGEETSRRDCSRMLTSLPRDKINMNDNVFL